MGRATTVRFTDEIYGRLDQASARTGMPVNSIVVAACLEWMQRHTPDPVVAAQAGTLPIVPLPAAPRWATLRRALGQVTSGAQRRYPFGSFTEHAQELLMQANTEAQSLGHSYIGTEHLLMASFGESFHSAAVLGALGVERKEVEARLRGRNDTHLRRRMVPTSRVKKVVELAFRLAGDQQRVGTHHILLALSKEGEGFAAHVLNELGASPAKIEQEVAALKDPES
ncbi:MAG TPA: Clp protease N-terminal domain-containing protein [Candidatus Dormibacteraeota bacterium]|nr:Clp protease N-terminal domain-containing protein [Candidatus Dormibacteraeota bacterium]